MSAIRAIQTAVYAILVADSTLLALATGGIHNDVPEGAAYPHVLISKATETPEHTFGSATTGLGWNDIIRIHVYSRTAGDMQATLILERVVVLLNFQPVVVPGYGRVSCEYLSARVLVENIDKIETRHIPAEFRVRVHQ